MIRLFTEPYETYTQRGNELSLEVSRLFRPVVERAVEEDLSLRDLSYILSGEVNLLICEHLLRRNSRLAREERERARATVQAVP